MFFNLRKFSKFTYLSFFKNKETPYQLTPKRLVWLISFYFFFPIWQAIIWSGLALDELFYPEHEKTRIKQPVFIVGNPRSGTTFLHRLLAKDRRNFNTMKTWEMFAAPSIILRKLLKNLANLDRKIGQPGLTLLTKIQDYIQRKNVIHKVAFWKPEEDDNLLTHIWSTLKIWTLTGMLEEAHPYTYFDQAMPQKEKKRIFSFYKKCLRRHLFFHRARNKHYLAKNPCFTPMIDTLYQEFPDCRIVYLVRNPLKMIPSYLSLTAEEWRMVGHPQGKKYASRDYILEMAKHWYQYPLKRFRKTPRNNYAIINYDQLVKNPKKVLEKVYQKFDLKMSKRFSKILEKTAQRQKDRRSLHQYSLSKMGLNKKKIIEKYRAIFRRFKFKTVFQTT